MITIDLNDDALLRFFRRVGDETGALPNGELLLAKLLMGRWRETDSTGPGLEEAMQACWVQIETTLARRPPRQMQASEFTRAAMELDTLAQALADEVNRARWG